MATDVFLPIAAATLKGIASLMTNSASLDVASELLESRRRGPETLGELINEDIFWSKLSLSVAAKLGIPFGSAEGSYSRKILVQEYAKYVDIREGDGKVRWGIAIRWISNIKVLDAKANLSSLPVISASAELGYVEASSKFQVRGMSSQRITELMPDDMELSIENYLELKDALEAIKGEIWSDQTTISPTVLSIHSDVRDESESKYHEALAASWALNRVKKGHTLNRALSDDPIGTSDTQETITSVYSDIIGTTDRNVEPDSVARDRAKKVLHGIKVRG